MNSVPPAATVSGFFESDAAYRRPRASPLYQLWVLAVALLMVLLPVIYAALWGLVAWGVYYHGTHNFGRIMAWGGLRLGWRIELFKLAVYAAPLAGGVVMLLFMVKPIFAGRARQAQPYGLNPEAEPRLFAFLSEVCRIVGAPAPSRIDLDCELNAAARFRRGFRSFFGHDLVLVLGLPLVATLTVEEFAGVLGHEFGHFTQGVGMRLGYLIRWINLWFARVVFERDAWDEMLADWERDAEGAFLSLMVAMAQLGVWLSRGILHLLMLLGHVVGSSMLRQMEFNADACEIRLVGSEAFERLMRRLAVLDCAHRACYREMRVMWNNEHTLPNNYSQFLANKVQALPGHLKGRVDDTLGFHRTRLLDDHPCDAERIRQARQMAEPGLIRSQEPAFHLFENFQVPAQFVTLFHYRDAGIPITPQQLRPIEASREEFQQTRTRWGDIAGGYFQGLLPLMHPVFLLPPQLAPPPDPAAARQKLKEFRPRLAAVAAPTAELASAFCAAEQGESRAAVAAGLLDAGCALDPAAFGLEDGSADNARRKCAECAAAKEKCRRRLRLVCEEMLGHFAAALALLFTPETTANVAEAAGWQSETRRLTAFLGEFSKSYALLSDCRREQSLLEAWLQLGANPPPRSPAIAISAKRLNDLLNKLRDETWALSNPFEDGKQSGCLYDRLVGDHGDLSDPSEVALVAGRAVERFTEQYESALGRLAQIAQEMEGR